eukprot:144107-Pelagomonas_calceolata.AAC.1
MARAPAQDQNGKCGRGNPAKLFAEAGAQTGCAGWLQCDACCYVTWRSRTYGISLKTPEVALEPLHTLLQENKKYYKNT